MRDGTQVGCLYIGAADFRPVPINLCAIISTEMDKVARNWQGPGGTPGGIGQFVIGSIMAIAGSYLLLNQVTVTSGFWSYFGGHSFGVTLIPFLFGIGLLFYKSNSIPGWVLTAAGFLIIITGIIANMQIYFRPASLFSTLVMLVLLVGGLALVLRSLRSYSTD
jgi:hypothetical protein